MKFSEIQTIGIIGGGVMGNGIANVAAAAEYTVIIFDISPQAIQSAKNQIESFTQKAVEKGKSTESERNQLLNNISYTTDLRSVKADFIIEAVLEKLELKQQIFKELEEINSDKTILTTNTSSIPVTQIAAALKHPERFAGMHFFNPAQLMKLVEVIAGVATSAETTQLVLDLTLKLGKTPALVKDSPGFIVNRVARHFYLESQRIVEEGVADIETVDALLEATGFKMGAFKLMDLIGIETNHEVTKSLYNSFFQEARFRPSRLQQKMVEAGYFGRKTGKGFYKYK